MVTRLKQPHVSNSSTETSSEAMSSLNGDNGRGNITARRLTKRKTNSGTSLISQRSAAPPIRNGLRRDTSSDTLANSSTNDGDEEQCTPPQTTSVNDVSREISPSNLKDIWASVPRPTLRAYYKLHNPLGPRWYRNHHLIPQSHFKPSMRPPTFFSSSFPPIGTASHDYPDDEDPSRSPSHSPLPTPESSQTRVQDGLKPRSRKTSQTAPDAIDMLDLSDPWGQNWHHKSPYEFGQTTTVASLDTTDLPNRPRRASFSVSHARQRSVAPSPLSQSTSAVNLPSLQPEIKPPRKLSKRKTTNVTTIFQDPPPEVDRKAKSVPATPIDAPVLHSTPFASDIPPKRMSISPAGPFMSTPSPTPKREKRGSLLNRLVKKFSTLKRGSEPILGGVEGWNYETSSTTIDRRQTPSAGAVNTYAFPEKPDSSGDRPEDDKAVHPQQEDDRASLSSLEIPYSVMGKLTVVNPDPGEEENEFIAVENPTPPELENENSPSLLEHDKEVHSSPEPPNPVPDDSPAFPSDAELETSFDKPLPPRLGTPRFSRLVMSEITVSTPEVMEQPLPPLPPKDVIPQEPSIVREATRSPSPDNPPEQPESPRLSTFDPFHVVNSISLDHTAHERPSPTPLQTQVTPASLKHAASQRKSTSPPKEVPSKPIVEQRQTQSPPVAATVQRDLSDRQSSNRNAAPSTEVTPTTERKTGSLRSANGPVSLSSRELPAEFKFPPSRTRSRSNSRLESRSVPASVQIPRFPAFHTDSPISTSSILANPPTPYDHRISINFSDRSSTPPTVPPKSIRHRSPPPPKTTGTIKRQTETFKLVRSSSGNVYASSQTILAQGQQWEVVESVEITKKDRSMRFKANEKSKDRDREREIDREREHEKARELERERQRAREKDLEREKQRAREREIEEKAREERERREAERILRESEVQREKEREVERIQRELEIQREQERERREVQRIQRELEIQRERERTKEKERREQERIQRESKIQREKERERREAERLQRELDFQREWERTREWERREVEREMERQREKEKEREREHARHREQEREGARQREKDREREQRERDGMREERMRGRDKDREKRKERERREREREKERERRREREREKEREREERERWELERERQRKVRSHEEAERRAGHHHRKSRDYDLKSREYERRSRDYDPRTDGSEHKSRDEARTHETDRRPIGYDQSSKRESRPHEKPSSRHYEDSRPHDNRRKYDDHRSTRHPTEMSSSSYSQHQPEPVVQPLPMPEPQPVRLERMPSVSARPMSQLPSADEMNAVRAKEQWDMERLYKARSLHGLEPNGTANHVIPGHGSTSSMSDDIPEIDHPASPPPHGSGHTAYLVQTPFQDSRPQIYRSMPTSPPQMYYHSPASIPSIPDSLSSYDPYETLQFYPGPAQVAEPLPPPSLLPKYNNPLPEPPRESPYNPTALPSFSPHRRSTEYWTINGITTAH